MKRGSTFFLKTAVFLVGSLIFALCISILFLLANDSLNINQSMAYLLYPFLISLFITSIPFFFALYQVLKLLSYIDGNKAFSQLSVKALKNIKHCAVIISAIYVPNIPLLVLMSNEDDAPGVLVLGLAITFASMVVAVFAAVLQKLLKEAIDIKEENDLTV